MTLSLDTHKQSVKLLQSYWLMSISISMYVIPHSRYLLIINRWCTSRASHTLRCELLDGRSYSSPTTSQMYSGQAKTTLQITCPDTKQPRTSDQVENRRWKRNTWNSFHRRLCLMQSYLRKYKPPPQKTRYFKPLSNYAIPDAGMKSTSMTLTRTNCVNSRTRES